MSQPTDADRVARTARSITEQTRYLAERLRRTEEHAAALISAVDAKDPAHVIAYHVEALRACLSDRVSVTEVVRAYEPELIAAATARLMESR